MIKSVRFDQLISLHECLTHIFATPKNLCCDGADHFASLFILLITKVCGGGLNLVVDGDTIKKHVLHGVKEELLGVEEGLTHVF